MHIKDAKVYDYPALGWANPPRLDVLVDHLLKWEDKRIYRIARTSDMIDLSADQSRIAGFGIENPKPMKFQNEGTAYYNEIDGDVSFFFHNPRNEQGYGGAIFKGKLEDGTEFSVRGPWSSNPGAMKKLFGVDTMDVSITDDPEVWERGYTFYAGHITVELAKEAIPFILPDFTIEDEEPYLTRLTPLVLQYPEGSPNWHKREYERKKKAGQISASKFIPNR